MHSICAKDWRWSAMGVPINKTELYRMRYPKGTIIELTAPIEDPYTPKPVGSRFEVACVDDVNQLQGHWLAPASGSIAVIIGVDQFRVIK